MNTRALLSELRRDLKMLEKEQTKSSRRAWLAARVAMIDEALAS